MDAIQESLTQIQNELQVAAPYANIVSLITEFTIFRQFIVLALRNIQDQVSLLAQQTNR